MARWISSGHDKQDQTPRHGQISRRDPRFTHLRLDSVVLGDLIVRTSLMTLQSFVQEKNKCNAH